MSHLCHDMLRYSIWVHFLVRRKKTLKVRAGYGMHAFAVACVFVCVCELPWCTPALPQRNKLQVFSHIRWRGFNEVDEGWLEWHASECVCVWFNFLHSKFQVVALCLELGIACKAHPSKRSMWVMRCARLRPSEDWELAINHHGASLVFLKHDVGCWRWNIGWRSHFSAFKVWSHMVGE